MYGCRAYSPDFGIPLAQIFCSTMWGFAVSREMEEKFSRTSRARSIAGSRLVLCSGRNVSRYDLQYENSGVQPTTCELFSALLS